jgi:hypothetical protein
VAAPLLLALSAGVASAQQVGTAAAVNQDASVSGRTLSLGAAIMHKERIQTDGKGSLQLLFVDRTSMSIGPNSSIVIDEYVYDPGRSAGRMTVSLTKGVMRFVGGQISHSGEATVKTPPATIGIRGGVAVITTSGGKTTATNVFGSVVMTSRGAPGATSVPQGQTGSTGAGGVVGVAPTSTQQLTSTNRQMQSSGTQTGGASGRAAATARAIGNSGPGVVTGVTPASSPAAGSTASGPASTGGTTTSFTTGLPTGVTGLAPTVQSTTSSSGAGASAPGPGGGGGGKCCL